MAEYERREWTPPKRVQFVLKNPTNSVEYGKAYAAIVQEFEAVGRTRYDNSITVEADEDAIRLVYEDIDPRVRACVRCGNGFAQMVVELCRVCELEVEIEYLRGRLERAAESPTPLAPTSMAKCDSGITLATWASETVADIMARVFADGSPPVVTIEKITYMDFKLDDADDLSARLRAAIDWARTTHAEINDKEDQTS